MVTAPIVVIVGQTGSGKSALAIKLAQKYNSEIICADSRTIYKGMDIGTAKPSAKDQSLAVHHCLNLVDPSQTFSAAGFKTQALQAIDAIYKKGKLPIMVGGSGLYIDSVLFDYQFSAHGGERDAQNPRHLKKSDQPASPRKLRQNTLMIGVRVTKEILDERIEQRVDSMFKAGLINEVKDLLAMYGEQAPGLNSSGYKSVVLHLKNDVSMDEARSQFIRSHKQLATRQMTWFKRNSDIIWVQSFEQTDGLVQDFVTKFDTMSL